MGHGTVSTVVLHRVDAARNMARFYAMSIETTLFGGRIWSNYAAPDPCCNTSGSNTFFSPSERLDRRWRFGVTQSIRVRDNVDIVLQFQRDIVSSNLPLYAYTSNSVLVGTQVRF